MAHVSDSGSPDSTAEQAKIALAEAAGEVEASHDGHLKIEALIAAAQRKP